MKPASSTLSNDPIWFVNAGLVFSMGMFVVAGGSASTSVYFAAAAGGLLGILLGRFHFVSGKPVTGAALVFAGLFASILIAAVGHPNRVAGIDIAFSNLQLVVFPLIAAGLWHTPRVDYLRLFVRGLCVGVTIAAGFGLAQVVWLGIYPSGISGNLLVYATLCAISGLLCLTFIDMEKGFWRAMALAGFGCAILVAGMTLAKSSIAMLLLLSPLVLAYLAHQLSGSRAGRLQTAGLAVGILAMLVVGILFSLQFPGFIEERLFSVMDRFEKNGLSLGGLLDPLRHRLMVAGWVMFTENPVSGVGPQNTISTAQEMYLAADGYLVRDVSHLHNAFLDHLAGSGFFGWVLFVAFLAIPVWAAITSHRDMRFANRVYFGTVLSLGYVVVNLTNVHTSQDLLMSHFCFAALMLCLACKQASGKVELFLEHPAKAS